METKQHTAPVSDAALWYVLVSLGRGDADAGRDLLLPLARRVRYARDVHPEFGGMDSVRAEMSELEEAHPGVRRSREEAIDVMATCVRLINGEHLR